MHQLQVIGNLGADAEVVDYNGNKFLSFRVAHSEKFTSHGEQQERSLWYSVTSNQTDSKVIPYLKKGVKVFVQGAPTYRLYDSQKYRQKMLDVGIFATRIELCGSAPSTGLNQQGAQEQTDPLGLPETEEVKAF